MTPARRATVLVALLAAVLAAAVGAGVFAARHHDGAPARSASPSPTARAVPAPSPSGSDGPGRARWLADVDAALSGASDYLSAHRGVHRPALVLDIDNTALQSHYFGGAATPAVLAVERVAVRSGYSILFATGRAASTKGSVAALTKAGYRVDALCKRPSTKIKLQVSKANCRANWTKSGYTIVADIGNRSTDFMGGHTGRVFKLPNYGFLS